MKYQKYHSLIIVLLFVTTTLFAQPFHDWTFTMGGDAGVYNEGAYEIFMDDQGYLYTYGFFAGEADFERGEDSVLVDSYSDEFLSYYIAKYDSTGHNIWAFPLDVAIDNWVFGIAGKPIAMDVSPSGDVYVLVLSDPLADLDPGIEEVFFTEETQHVLIKYSVNGEYLWSKGFDFNQYSSLNLDEDENIILSGSIFDVVDFDPNSNEVLLGTEGDISFFLAKYDLDGNYIWAMANEVNPAFPQTFSGVNDVSPDIDSEGNIYVFGSFTGTVDMDPSIDTFQITAPNGVQAFMVKYTPQGGLVWVHTWGSNPDNPMHFCEGIDMEMDQDDNILITGLFHGANDFDFSDETYILDSDEYTNFIAKYSKDAEILWAFGLNEFADLYIYEISCDFQNNIYLTGQVAKDLDFDPGPETQIVEVSDGPDIFLAKYSPEGQYTWAFGMGGDDGGGAQQRGMDVIIDANDIIYTTGKFSKTCDFDPTDCEYNRTSTVNDKTADSYIAKYTQTCIPSSTPIIESETDFLCLGEITKIDVLNYNELNNGNYWYLYENSCGGMVVDSSEFGHFEVSPLETTTYFIVGQGCCFSDMNCDSITIEVSLEIEPTYSDKTICIGDSILIFGNYESEAQVFIDTFSSSFGCDSIHSIELFVNSSSTSEEKTICFGDSILIFGNFENQAQIYIDTFSNVLGCDSTHSIELFVNSISNQIEISEDSLIAVQENGMYQWNDCDTGLPIENADMQVFVPSVSGNYSVTIMLDGCEIESECINLEILSIKSKYDLSEIELYPNPVKDLLEIRIENYSKRYNYELFDIKGMLIHKGQLDKNKYKLDMSSYESGAYLLGIQKDKERIVKMIVKI